jgi:hypothetical protein
MGDERPKECGALIGPEGETCGVPRDQCREHRRPMSAEQAAQYTLDRIAAIRRGVK